MHRLLWTVLILFCSLSLAAQEKHTQTVGQVWAGYVNQTRLTKHWGLWVDGHLRTQKGMVDGLGQGLARAGLTYYASENTWLTAGYAYVHDYPGEGHRYAARPEQRPWQQVQWLSRHKGFSSTQRLRLEERFRRTVLNDSTLGNGYRFNFRLRYSTLFQVPLTTGTAHRLATSLVGQDEVMVNFGRQVVYNYFDQNRFFAGLNIQLAPNNVVQAGYMNIFQQLFAGNRYRVSHVARVYYLHNLDTRKKKK